METKIGPDWSTLKFDIVFRIKGAKLAYNPTSDITPQEVALMIPLIAVFLSDPRVNASDLSAYVKKHNLQRHFTEVK